MKIFRFSLLICLLSLFYIPVNAGFVTADEARQVALNYLSQKGLIKQTDAARGLTMTQVATLEAGGLPAIYVFTQGADDFILIPADNALTPVLGYSTESSFPPKGYNLNFDSFIQTYADQVQWVRETSVAADEKTAYAWRRYTDVQTDSPGLVKTVGPFITAKWNQNSPYNLFCPSDTKGPGGNTYAGCVATAMSMIMYHYRYPDTGTGKHSYIAGSYGLQSVDYSKAVYDWDAMQTTVSMASSEGIPANALLQYHTGVSVDMDYSYDGSGAFSSDVPQAMKDHFRYSPYMKYYDKGGYATTEWEGMIMEDLDDLKPVYYSGHSSEGGHAFVCDGYQSTDSDLKFHFNFGWGGSSNGYYTTADPHDYKSDQGIIRNFIPGSNYPPGCVSKTLTLLRGSFEDGSGPRDSYGTNLACNWLVAPTDSVKSIALSFIRFQVDPSDTLFVYDGPDASYPRLAALTGDSIPGTLRSTSSRLYIEFATNYTKQANGWLAEYTSTPAQFCGGTKTFTDPDGTISDGSGDYNAINSANCQFKILPPDASDITLTFNEFDLEPKDFVSVYSLPSNTLLGEYTGNTVPAPLTVPSGGFFVRFKSDAYTPSKGFKASYSIGNVGNAKLDQISSLTITPNPATDFVMLRANSAKAQQLQVEITDMSGKILRSERFATASGTIEKPVPVSNFRRGMYFLTIRTENGSTSTQKIIIR